MIIYLFVALCLSVLSCVAFSGSMGVLLSLAVGFFGAVIMITFVETLISGSNLGFGLAKKILLWGLKNLARGWSFLAIVAAIPALLVLAVLLAPVWYYLENYVPAAKRGAILTRISSLGAAFDSFTHRAWLPLFLVGIGVMLVAVIITFAFPIVIYRLMHWGFWIAVVSVLSLLLISIPIRHRADRSIKSQKVANWLVVLCLSFIAVTGVAIYSSTDNVYYISDASDMRIFGRAPQSYDTAFVLENDIDFGGKKVTWYGKYVNFKGVFDGRGHTLSNFSAGGNMASVPEGYGTGMMPQSFGMVCNNFGSIRNLTIDRAKITIGYNTLLPHINYGTLAGFNISGGKITDCEVRDSQARYIYMNKDYKNMSMTVGSNSGEVSGVIETYTEGFENDSEFILAGTEEWVRVHQDRTQKSPSDTE